MIKSFFLNFKGKLSRLSSSCRASVAKSSGHGSFRSKPTKVLDITDDVDRKTERSAYRFKIDGIAAALVGVLGAISGVLLGATLNQKANLALVEREERHAYALEAQQFLDDFTDRWADRAAHVIIVLNSKYADDFKERLREFDDYEQKRSIRFLMDFIKFERYFGSEALSNYVRDHESRLLKLELFIGGPDFRSGKTVDIESRQRELMDGAKSAGVFFGKLHADVNNFRFRN